MRSEEVSRHTFFESGSNPPGGLFERRVGLHDEEFPLGGEGGAWILKEGMGGVSVADTVFYTAGLFWLFCGVADG